MVLPFVRSLVSQMEYQKDAFMAWDPGRTNQLLFTYGDIQFSPAEIQQLNAQPPTVYQSGFALEQPSAGYIVLLSGYSNAVRDKEIALGHRVRIDRTITSLRSNPRPPTSKQLKGSVDTLSHEGDYYRVDYRINSGQIMVYNIEPVDAIQRARDKLEKVALYRVKKRQGVWRISEKTDQVVGPYAAINGQSNNLAKAPWLMGAHLEFEFGKAVNEFTLFHNPSVGGLGDTWESMRDKLGFTTDVTRKFADALSRAQKADHKVRWVAHSQGGVIFAEAVRYILNGNSSWALNNFSFNGINHEDRGAVLNKHSVAMHGNANNNWRSSHLFERAGVEVIATRANSYDFVNTLIGANTANPWRLLGSVVYSKHVFSGSLQQSPHSLMHRDWKSWNSAMTDGPGKGRGPIQKGFHAVDSAGRGAVKAISNYLK